MRPVSFLLCCGMPVMFASTGDIYVNLQASCAMGDGSASSPFCTVSEALSIAANGDVIRIAPGTYRERVTVDRDITLKGEQGAAVTSLDGELGGTVVTLAVGTDVSIDGLTVTGGLGSAAGGIHSQGCLVLRNSTVRGNEATGGYSGGAILHDSDGAFTLDGCRITENVADMGSLGAPVLKMGAGLATIRGSHFEGNRGWASGAIEVRSGPLEMSDSTVHGNTSLLRVGAIVFDGDGLVLVNSTINENQGSGVHFRFYATGSLEVRSCTVTDNFNTSTFYAGALDSAASVPVLVSNSILVGGGIGDVFGSFLSGGYNVVGAIGINNPTFAPAIGDILGWVNPPVPVLELMPLADNGGRVFTRMPACDSFLIDSGPLVPPDALDQRGVPRSAGRVDRGAVESDCGRVPACAAVPNSTGAEGRLGFVGGTATGADQFGLRLTDGPPLQFAMLAVSRTPQFQPGAGGSVGNLCLGGVIGRYSAPGQLRQLDGSGSTEFPVPLASVPQGGGVAVVQAGETWFFQAWHRDRMGMTNVSNFTSTAAMTFR